MLLAALTITAILGRWQGESICTKVPGNEACHDEHVRHDFVAKDKVTVTDHAYKLVDGKYEPMGDLDFTFNAKKQEWSSKFHTGRGDAIWSFKIDGDQMKGVCVVAPDTLVRNVRATRVKP